MTQPHPSATDLSPPDLPLLAALERHSARAWPAPEVVSLNGWELRFAPGSRSRRVNCLTPVAPVPGSFPQTLEVARKLAADHGVPCTVRLQPLAGPEPEAALRAMGLAPQGMTSVQVAPLGHLAPAPEGVTLSEGFDAGWAEAMGLAHEDEPEERAIIARMLSHVGGEQILARVDREGMPAAFGRSVVDHGLAGIFHIVTDARFRRQGHARRLVAALMAAARARGAMRAYLQVTLANAQALPLYASLGFREAYRYDYWTV